MVTSEADRDMVTDEELGAAFRKIVLYWPALVDRLERVYGVLQLSGKTAVCEAVKVALEALRQELEDAKSV